VGLLRPHPDHARVGAEGEASVNPQRVPASALREARRDAAPPTRPPQRTRAAATRPRSRAQNPSRRTGPLPEERGVRPFSIPATASARAELTTRRTPRPRRRSHLPRDLRKQIAALRAGLRTEPLMKEVTRRLREGLAKLDGRRTADPPAPPPVPAPVGGQGRPGIIETVATEFDAAEGFSRSSRAWRRGSIGPPCAPRSGPRSARSAGRGTRSGSTNRCGAWQSSLVRGDRFSG
jgi:hypothetical protein